MSAETTETTQTTQRDARPPHEQLAEMQRLSGIGDWAWHVPSDVVTWSAEQHRLFGVDPVTFEPTYAAWMEAIHPDDREMVAEAVGAAFANHHGWAFDHRVVRPDGSVTWMHCRGEAQVEDGDVIRMVGVSMDINERMATERYLRDFVSSAAHELRTPVTSIYQAIALLKDGVGGEHTNDLIDVIDRQADRLRALTTDLLDLSALAEPGATVMLSLVDVREVVDRVVERSAGAVDVDVPAGTVVRGSGPALERVLENLLENAHRHGGAPVRVTASGDAQVVIAVEDAGAGVPTDLRDRLFTPFVGGGAGSGLGLALVRRMAQSMAGSVEHERVDDRTRFLVRLSAT